MPFIQQAGLETQRAKQYTFRGLTNRNKKFMITSAASVPDEDEKNTTLDLYQERGARAIGKLWDSHRYNVVEGRQSGTPSALLPGAKQSGSRYDGPAPMDTSNRAGGPLDARRKSAVDA